MKQAAHQHEWIYNPSIYQDIRGTLRLHRHCASCRRNEWASLHFRSGKPPDYTAYKVLEQPPDQPSHPEISDLVANVDCPYCHGDPGCSCPCHTPDVGVIE